MNLLDLRTESRKAMPRVPDLPHLAKAAIATWSGRMVNETRSATVFESLAGELAAAGFDAEQVSMCRAFGDEERRHGVLCGAVVEALGGQAKATIVRADGLPRHSDVDPIEGALRNLLSVSCLSETVAVALIGAERLEMPEGELRELLTSIWSDEVGHARFGWRIVHERVPALDAHAKRRLSIYLSSAMASVEDYELQNLPAEADAPDEGAALGLCRGSDSRALFYDTVETVILPQLEAAGLHARKAWALRRKMAAAASS
jgi:hypothetical protein